MVDPATKVGVMRKVNHCTIKTALRSHGVDFGADFHALPRSQVDRVLDAAKLVKYRKSKTAPGSRARMYFQMLARKGC